MGQERNRILELLAESKISTDEAARLLDALDGRAATGQEGGSATTAVRGAEHGDAEEAKAPSPPKFMYVKVVSTKGDNVNVKIPLALVRAGLKLTNLIPPSAMERINRSMADHGMSMDLSNIKPEELEELIQSLREMEVNVDADNGDTVRVFCA